MTGWSRDKDVIGGTPLSCDNPVNPVVTTVTAGQNYELPQLDTKSVSLVDLLIQRSQAAGEIAPVVQVKDFREKIGGLFVIDVRQPEHYAAGHIDGAVNIPYRNIAEMDNLKKIPADKNLMMVGYDAYAASQAARLLNRLGYKATVLKDGMSAWVADEKIIGAKPLACNVTEKPVAKLNAPLTPGPSSAAT